MSISSFLFQGSAPTPAPTGSDTSTSSPEWLQSYLFDVLGAARNVAGLPLSTFPGPTVAAPSDVTKQSWAQGQQNVGNYQPFLQSAQNLTQQASSPLDQNQIQSFLNPYQDYITGALNRNLTQNLLPSIQDKFVSAGQSRSPQEQEITSRALRDTQGAVGESMAGAYQGAIQDLLAQRQQQQVGGAQMGTLGSLTSQLGGYDVGTLASIGQAQDTQNQANINAAIAQFQQQQQYPYQQVGFMSDILRGFPTGAAGQTQQTVGTQYLPSSSYGASPLSSFIGAAGIGKSLGLRRGGHVGTLSEMKAAPKNRRPPKGTLGKMAA